MGYPFIPAVHHGSADNFPIHRIVIHDVECPVYAGAAKAVAQYYGGSGAPIASPHYIVDPANIYQMLPDNVIGYHAPPNQHSIGIEHTGYAKFNAAQWVTGAELDTLKRSAVLMAALCTEYGIPVTLLSVNDLLAGKRGITFHRFVSEAWHQSDHWDPGYSFPIDMYLNMVRSHMGGAVTPPAPGKPAPKPAPKPVAHPAAPAPAVSKSWPAYPGSSAFAVGRSSNAVLLCGQALVAAGFGKHYRVGPSTSWGEADRLNVVDFQHAQGWTGADADGYPGQATWHLLGVAWTRAHAPKPAPAPKPVPKPVPAPLPVPTIAWPGYSVIKPGLKNADVLAMQHRLAALGFACAPTSVYDDATKKAVALFQSYHPPTQPADGVAGPVTWATLYAASTTPKPAAPTVIHQLNAKQVADFAREAGFTGSGLEWAVAVALAESGGRTNAVHLNADPHKTTDRGLWQINNFWHPDVSDAQAFDALGCAKAAFKISSGGQSWSPWSTYNNGAAKALLTQAKAAIAASIAAKEVPSIFMLHAGMTAVNVRYVQHWLGVNPVTGFYGPATVAAVKTYQQVHGLPVTGVVDGVTWDGMNPAK